MVSMEKPIESSTASVKSNDKNLSEPASEIVIDDAEYLSGPRLGLVVLGLCLAVLLIGLVSIYKSGPAKKVK